MNKVIQSPKSPAKDNIKEFKVIKLKAVKPRKAQLHFTKGH